MQFAGVTGWKSAAVTTYDAGPSAEPCMTLAFNYFRDRRALTIESRTVIVLTKEIVYPVVDVVSGILRVAILLIRVLPYRKPS